MIVVILNKWSGSLRIHAFPIKQTKQSLRNAEINDPVFTEVWGMFLLEVVSRVGREDIAKLALNAFDAY